MEEARRRRDHYNPGMSNSHPWRHWRGPRIDRKTGLIAAVIVLHGLQGCGGVPHAQAAAEATLDPAAPVEAVSPGAPEAATPPMGRTTTIVVAAPAAPPPRPALDPAASEWLDKIQSRSAEIRTLSATVRYDRVQGLLEDRQRRFGTLAYLAGPPARFSVHFDRLMLRVGDRWRADKQNRRYLFDGRWLVERYDDEKVFRKTEVAGPEETGADPLSAGTGPFVLPLSGKKAAIVERFDVSLVAETAEGDPANAVHLKLTPPSSASGATRPSGGFSEVHLWYDRGTLLPVRVRTLDDSENESIIDLSEVQVNARLDASAIDVSEPRGSGWDVTVTPLRPPAGSSGE